MHRIDDPTASPTLPAPRPPGTPGYFTGGSPGSSGFAATVVRYEFMNAVQEELVAVIQAAQLVLDKTNNGQLLEALRTMLRFKLTQDETIYISPTGNDSNDGLTPTTALATGQVAWNMAMSVDLNGHNMFLQFAHGTYTTPIVCSGSPLGRGASNNIIINGDTTNPDQVIFSVANGNCIYALNEAIVVVQGVHLTATGAATNTNTIGTALVTTGSGIIVLGSGVVFGACDHGHMLTSFGGIDTAEHAYQIEGGASFHMSVGGNGYLSNAVSAVTLTGTPNFSTAFAIATGGGFLNAWGTAYSGAATGVRYNVSEGGIIQTFGAPSTYFPGSVAGVADAPTYGLIY
jgi:hypothetical protein